MVIRRVGVLSVAKVAGLLYGAMGLLFGACIALFSLAGATVAADEEFPAFFGLLFGMGAVVFLPILYGILGFLFIGLLAALYNFVAGMTGGVVVDVE
jgi:hypothetical protein